VDGDVDHQIVTFTLARDDADAVLARVTRLPGVLRAARVSPQSKSSVGRRICYADVAPGDDVGAVCRAIAALDGVESADVPRRRTVL